MFDSIGWGEIVVLALAALFIFGPDRLPHLAKDAASGLKKLRGAVAGVRGHVNEALGEDFPQLRELDLGRYNPKTYLRQQLIGEDDDSPRPNGSSASSSGGTVAAPETIGSRARSMPPRDEVDSS